MSAHIVEFVVLGRSNSPEEMSADAVPGEGPALAVLHGHGLESDGGGAGGEAGGEAGGAAGGGGGEGGGEGGVIVVLLG